MKREKEIGIKTLKHFYKWMVSVNKASEVNKSRIQGRT